MIKHTLTPYLPGHNFDRVVVKITDDGWVFVYCCELDESTTLRFCSPHYKPAPGRSEEGQVADVIGFAMAYIERPEEFDRAGRLEQWPENREWWLRHGEALLCEVDSGD